MERTNAARESIRSARSVVAMCGYCAASLTLLGAFGDGCNSGDTAIGAVGTATCIGCHDGRTALDRRESLEGPHGAVDCEVCHGPGLLHVRNSGRGGLFIENPGRKPFETSKALCAECHETLFDGYQFTGHFEAQAASCLDCHDPHKVGGMRFSTPAAAALAHADFEQTCGTCHPGQVDDYASSVHAGQNGLTCRICHDMHMPETFVLPVQDNSLCMQCHASPSIGFETDEDVNRHTGLFHPVTPGENGASRCVSCHMVPAIAFDDGFGALNHTLSPVPPQVSIDAIDAGLDPVPPNSCAGATGCHVEAAPGPGAFHDPADRGQNVIWQVLFESIGGRTE